MRIGASYIGASYSQINAHHCIINLTWMMQQRARMLVIGEGGGGEA